MKFNLAYSTINDRIGTYLTDEEIACIRSVVEDINGHGIPDTSFEDVFDDSDWAAQVLGYPSLDALLNRPLSYAQYKAWIENLSAFDAHLLPDIIEKASFEESFSHSSYEELYALAMKSYTSACTSACTSA